jgi:hypothetical protein
MTEFELMDILQQEGWTISKIEANDNQQVFRAGRFRKGHGQTRYIATANTLKKRTREDILKALARETKPMQRRAGADRKPASSAKETCLATVGRRHAGQGMPEIDFTPPFEERSRVYFRLARSK